MESESNASQRSAAYSFLCSAFLTSPSAEEITLRNPANCIVALEELAGTTPLNELREWAAGAVESEAADQLRLEFVSLFHVPGPRSIALYESVFRDTREVDGRSIKGLLMGQSAFDVQKWYRLAALDISPDFHDLPDHVSLELKFMATLCSMEAEFLVADQGKWIRCREMQRDFLAAHLKPWVEDLAKVIKQRSSHPYFRALSDALVTCVLGDLDDLECALGKSTNQPVPAYHRAPD